MLVMRELHVKASVSYHSKQMTMALLKRVENNKCRVRMPRNGECCTLLAGMETSAATVEGRRAAPQKT